MDKNLIDGLDDKDWALIRCQEMIAIYHLITLQFLNGRELVAMQLYKTTQAEMNGCYNWQILEAFVESLPEMIACAKNNKEVTLECIEENESRGNTKSTPEENDQDDIDKD